MLKSRLSLKMLFIFCAIWLPCKLSSLIDTRNVMDIHFMWIFVVSGYVMLLLTVSILGEIWKVKMKVSQSCPTLCDSTDYTVHGILQATVLKWSLSLLQGIFPTQGSNPCFPHCRQILYQLNHKGSQRVLEWVAYPFSSKSS